MRLLRERLLARRGRRGGDPRGAARGVGRTGWCSSATGGSVDETGHSRTGPSRCWPPALRRFRERARERRSRPARRAAVGVAAVPPGLAPAAAGAGAADRRRRRGHDGRDRRDERGRARAIRGSAAASGLAVLDATNPATAQDQVANARQRFGHVDVISHMLGRGAGLGRAASTCARRTPNGAVQPIRCCALRHGRYPKAANEVALTDKVAEPAGRRHRITPSELGGVERTVVGRVENPSDLSDDVRVGRARARGPAQTHDAAVRLQQRRR